MQGKELLTQVLAAERAQSVTTINTVPPLGLGRERKRLLEAGVQGAAGGGCSWAAPEPGAGCSDLRAGGPVSRRSTL